VQPRTFTSAGEDTSLFQRQYERGLADGSQEHAAEKSRGTYRVWNRATIRRYF